MTLLIYEENLEVENRKKKIMKTNRRRKHEKCQLEERGSQQVQKPASKTEHQLTRHLQKCIFSKP